MSYYIYIIAATYGIRDKISMYLKKEIKELLTDFPHITISSKDLLLTSEVCNSKWRVLKIEGNKNLNSSLNKRFINSDKNIQKNFF